MVYSPPVELYEKISEIMQQELSLNGADLIRQLVKLDSLRYEVAYTVAEWRQRLVNERERLLMPKDGRGTDLDRKTQIEAATSQLQRDTEFLENVNQIIADKLTLGQTLLPFL